MAKPVILTVDDDPEVLQAVARDLRQQYGARFRIVRADSGQSMVDQWMNVLAQRYEIFEAGFTRSLHYRKYHEQHLSTR